MDPEKSKKKEKGKTSRPERTVVAMSVEKSEISENSQFIAVNHLYTSGENPDFKVVMKFKDCSFNNSRISTTDPTGSEHALIRWNLPFPTQHFVGQKQYLDAIKRTLQQESHQPIILGIHGMGGVGKTYLVSKIVHDTDDEILKTYRFRAWFPADSQSSLERAYLELGEYLRLFSSSDRNAPLQTKITWVREHLEQRKKCLLVYDNAQSFRDLQSYLPQHGHHSILVTSRNPNWLKANAIEMRVMQDTDAKNLVTSLITREYIDSDALTELVAVLGRLPLAMSQASGYIEQEDMDIGKYLELYQVVKRQLLESGTLPVGDEHAPVFVTWDLNIKAIQKKRPEAIELLVACAYLHANNIPRLVLTHYLHKEVTDQAIFDSGRALNTLRDYSMLEVFPESVSIHRVIQDVMREKQEKEKHFDILQKLIIPLPSISHLGEEMNAEQIEFCRLLLPHAETMLSHFKLVCPPKLLHELMPKILETKLRLFIGQILFETRTNLEQSLTHFEKSLPMCEENLSSYKKQLCSDKMLQQETLEEYIQTGKFKENNLLTLLLVIKVRALNLLSLTLLHLARFEESHKFLIEALNTEKKYSHQLNGCSKLPIIYTNLTQVCYVLGRLSESSSFAAQAELSVHDDRKKFPLKASESVQIGILANINRPFEDPQQEVQALQNALETSQTFNSGQTEITALILDRLGVAYTDLNQPEKSVPLWQQSLKIKKILYGPDHRELLSTLLALIQHHYRRWYYDKLSDELTQAEALFEQVLEIFEKDDEALSLREGESFLDRVILFPLMALMAIESINRDSKEYIDKKRLFLEKTLFLLKKQKEQKKKRYGLQVLFIGSLIATCIQDSNLQERTAQYSKGMKEILLFLDDYELSFIERDFNQVTLSDTSNIYQKVYTHCVPGSKILLTLYPSNQSVVSFLEQQPFLSDILTLSQKQTLVVVLFYYSLGNILIQSSFKDDFSLTFKERSYDLSIRPIYVIVQILDSATYTQNHQQDEETAHTMTTTAVCHTHRMAERISPTDDTNYDQRRRQKQQNHSVQKSADPIDDIVNALKKEFYQKRERILNDTSWSPEVEALQRYDGEDENKQKLAAIVIRASEKFGFTGQIVLAGILRKLTDGRWQFIIRASDGKTTIERTGVPFFEIDDTVFQKAKALWENWVSKEANTNGTGTRSESPVSMASSSSEFHLGPPYLLLPEDKKFHVELCMWRAVNWVTPMPLYRSAEDENEQKVCENEEKGKQRKAAEKTKDSRIGSLFKNVSTLFSRVRGKSTAKVNSLSSQKQDTSANPSCTSSSDSTEEKQTLESLCFKAQDENKPLPYQLLAYIYRKLGLEEQYQLYKAQADSLKDCPISCDDLKLETLVTEVEKVNEPLPYRLLAFIYKGLGDIEQTDLYNARADSLEQPTYSIIRP